MTATLTLAETYSLAPGVRQNEFTVDLGNYITGGLAVDLSTWFHSRISKVEIQDNSEYWIECVMDDRTDTSAPFRIMVWRAGNTPYPKSNAYVLGVPGYIDEDGAGQNKFVFVSPTSATAATPQGEQKVELETGEGLSQFDVYLIVTGN